MFCSFIWFHVKFSIINIFPNNQYPPKSCCLVERAKIILLETKCNNNIICWFLIQRGNFLSTVYKMQIMINKMVNFRMKGLSKLMYVIIRVYNSVVNVFTRSSLDVLNYVIFQKVTYLVHYFKTIIFIMRIKKILLMKREQDTMIQT